MALNTIAILSPGDMGHGVGKVLVEARVPRHNVPGRQEPAH